MTRAVVDCRDHRLGLLVVIEAEVVNQIEQIESRTRRSFVGDAVRECEQASRLSE